MKELKVSLDNSIGNSLYYIHLIMKNLMYSMNALIALLLSIGYIITEKYKNQIKKIIGICILYFLLLCSAPFFKDQTTKFDLIVCIATLAITILISLLLFHFHSFLYSYLYRFT